MPSTPANRVGPGSTAGPAAPSDLAHAVWPTVPFAPLVLVPLGSTEQHGPHLPLGTDAAIARAVAERVAAGAPPEWHTLVAPTMAYGSSGEHAGFAGTVSIGREALTAVLVESVRSLAMWAGRIVFVNGHGGNVATLAEAVVLLRAEGHHVAWVPCVAPDADPHAGRWETSVMLHLAPGDVRTAQAVAGDTRPLADLMPDLVAGGVLAVSPSGVLGDPAGASAEEGEKAMTYMVTTATRLIAEGSADTRGRLVDAEAVDGTVTE
ncbi:mycofactocin biosynthesis peptidyl-dipeptidase MftE [Streptomyces sp. NPDC088910]|uniref:mycofactocin biosynthesis peptidyl-dipeptidase MftE n=1 Tax=Streptomyces sp. NPDC088910 TaxID=3365911 RepID=UPI0038215229